MREQDWESVRNTTLRVGGIPADARTPVPGIPTMTSEPVEQGNLLAFFLLETGARGSLVVAMIIACGAMNGVLVCVLAFWIDKAARPGVLPVAFAFLACVLLLLASEQYAHRRVTELSEQAIGRVRLRLVARARAIELLDLERIGPQRLLTLAARDLAAVSAMQREMLGCVANIAMAVVMLMVLLSVMPLIGVLAILVVVASVRSTEFKRIAEEEARAGSIERRFLGLAVSVVAGFKELKLDTRKSVALFDKALRPAAARVVAARCRARLLAYRFEGLQDATVYSIAALAAFGAPLLGLGPEATTATFITMYLVYPFSTLIWATADLAAGGYAVERLDQLEAELVAATPHRPGLRAPPSRLVSVRLAAASFTYPGNGSERPYGIGPVDLELVPGSITFLTGGNGSGKSTLLKLVAGLYPLSAGGLWLNDMAVDGPAVRAVFSSVFTDFHLFDRNYGVEHVDPGYADDLLCRLGLDGKTRLVDGAFTTTELSTGQRKRLALVVAILEDRPAYVFDEWAADQDPEFRAFFYEHLLPDLKAAGKAVIATTHDDRYFSRCDRLIVMEGGRMVAERSPLA